MLLPLAFSKASRSPIMRLLILPFAILLLAPLAGAQQPAEPLDEAPIRVTVEEVSVPFIVSDNRNRMVTDLTAPEILIKENGVPQTIRGFAQETDVPLRLGLLVDTSNSIRDRLAFE